MGDVISMQRHRRAREDEPRFARAARPRVTFFFDLASPFTYLAAERADRLIAGLEWRPACSDALYAGDPLAGAGADDRVCADAMRRAAALRMPLVWPERTPVTARAANRVAALAAERGCAAAFVLAAGRLAFCGGFDVEDPEILAEAAAAASLGLEDCLRAAGDARRDAALLATGDKLVAMGADRLPALRVGRVLFCGEDRITEAASAARAREDSVRFA